MRMLSFLRKSLKENMRDLMILIITLTMPPIYVLITYAVYNDTNQTYSILVDNRDEGITRYYSQSYLTSIHVKGCSFSKVQ